MKTAIQALVIAAGVLCTTGAAAQTSGAPMDDVSRGDLIFQTHCANCHDDSDHMLKDIGPPLFAVLGRRVGSVPGYPYSPVLQQAGERHDRWTASRLDAFLKQPELMYGGTGMPMNFDREKDRKAIIAYLRTLKAR